MYSVTDSLERRATAYTDAGTWKHSWHWKRTANGAITLQGAQQMLADLRCDTCEGEEILMAVQHIRERYKLAAELRDTIAVMEADAKDDADDDISDQVRHGPYDFAR